MLYVGLQTTNPVVQPASSFSVVTEPWRAIVEVRLSFFTRVMRQSSGRRGIDGYTGCLARVVSALSPVSLKLWRRLIIREGRVLVPALALQRGPVSLTRLDAHRNGGQRPGPVGTAALPPVQNVHELHRRSRRKCALHTSHVKPHRVVFLKKKSNTENVLVLDLAQPFLRGQIPLEGDRRVDGRERRGHSQTDRDAGQLQHVRTGDRVQPAEHRVSARTGILLESSFPETDYDFYGKARGKSSRFSNEDFFMGGSERRKLQITVQDTYYAISRTRLGGIAV